jgi:hypothetical protein
MNQTQQLGTVITRNAIDLVKEAGSLNEREGAPYLKLGSCLIKTAVDISYGVPLEDAVKRQFDPNDQLDAYSIISSMVKTSAKEEKEKEPSLLNYISSGMATGAGLLGMGGAIGAANYAQGKWDQATKPGSINIPIKYVRNARERPGTAHVIVNADHFTKPHRFLKFMQDGGYTDSGKLRFDKVDRYIGNQRLKGFGRGAISGLAVGGAGGAIHYLIDKYLRSKNPELLEETRHKKAAKEKEEREESLADKLLRHGLSGAGYGGAATGATMGIGSKLCDPSNKNALISALVGSGLGTAVGGTLGMGRGGLEYLLEQRKKKAEDKDSLVDSMLEHGREGATTGGLFGGLVATPTIAALPGLGSTKDRAIAALTLGPLLTGVGVAGGGLGGAGYGGLKHLLGRLSGKLLGRKRKDDDEKETLLGRLARRSLEGASYGGGVGGIGGAGLGTFISGSKSHLKSGLKGTGIGAAVGGLLGLGRGGLEHLLEPS